MSLPNYPTQVAFEYEKSFNEIHQRYTQKHEELLALLAESKCPPSKLRLTVYGIVNSGKSSILNILTESYDPERFRTGDSRVTTDLEEFETPDIIYVDTPGIDGDSEDNFVANQGKQKASIVLFVHQANSELESSEIDLLSQLINDFGDNAKNSILLTISRCDLVEDEDLVKLQNTIANQCKELLKTDLHIIPCSSTSYLASLTNSDPEAKQEFIKQSNFNALQDELNRMIKLNDPVQAFNTKLIQKRNQLRAELEQIRDELGNLSTNTQQYVKENLQGFDQHCRDLYSFVSTNKQQAINYSKEISEISTKLNSD